MNRSAGAPLHELSREHVRTGKVESDRTAAGLRVGLCDRFERRSVRLIAADTVSGSWAAQQRPDGHEHGQRLRIASVQFYTVLS